MTDEKTRAERLAYRLSEVALLTGLSVRALRAHVANGRLVATRPSSRTTLILAADLEHFLADARGTR